MTVNNDQFMNEELQKWIKESKEKINKSKKSKDSIKKDPSGLCEICSEKSAKFICLKCDRSVCLSCYFKIIGICKKCVTKETMEKWEGKPPDWENILGVEWVD